MPDSNLYDSEIYDLACVLYFKLLGQRTKYFRANENQLGFLYQSFAHDLERMLDHFYEVEQNA